jgi:hypothetical protein
MELKIFTLESIKAQKVVKQEDNMNVISSTWAFKCKRFPDDLIMKFKARCCACRDQQLEGIDFFETYDPVVQQTTICLIFVLEILLWLNKCSEMLSVLFCTQILRRTKRFTLTCQWDLLSMTRMKRKCALNSKIYSMSYIKVLEHPVGTFQSNSKHVA